MGTLIDLLKGPLSFYLGHDGNHALLIGEDSCVYFTGTSKRGEDADSSSKPRRPPKAETVLKKNFVRFFK